MLKTDEIWDTGQPISEYIMEQMRKEIEDLPFFDFFRRKPILIPMPSSSLKKPDSLWVPRSISKVLVELGLGSKVAECLKRVSPVRKASYSESRLRPKARDHYESLSVETLQDVGEALVVDDVVTRGANLLGAVSKLKAVFPRGTIQAFAVIRTISNANEFRKFEDPCVGKITLRSDGETFRRP